ncbi:monovalent cation:H+ antiporter-2, CPA2 family [Prosthecobacter debontii]|uniref:Monovalent cation:H+ antiporter-2, CPA2 family n=1 Tax=Prosthecobacter debontii TaxID=48467 RepID=A0A1T4Y9Z6_9BACT|nr:cation:proton antiporter [Prosthecobacter debontii]SKA98095.1 monovalent cation:H+ antiporter-2, CPA2 family [Prosthecobacter debontii]
MPFHLKPLLAAAEGLPPLFTLLAVMLTTVVIVSLLLLRLQQSLLAGYFICGIIVANSGILDLLGGGESEARIAQMSEFGVMLLMFTLGMEFSLSDLRYVRRLAFVGGGWQMGLCGVLGGLTAWWFGISVTGSILLAVALAMSSTAVSLKSFQDLGLESSPGARMALAVAIFQDLFIIVFFLVLPLLLDPGHREESIWIRIGSLLGRGGLFVLLAGIAARWIIPTLLNVVTRTRNRELFTLSVVGSCLGLAFVGGLLQLGLALGAFVAGLAVSESIFKHRILADIMPIKDLFLTLFFVSVGLMVDLQVAAIYWKPILALTLVLMVTKAGVITLIARKLGLVHRQALMAGIGLSSAGEFSLVLLQKAGHAGVWDIGLQQTFIASAALSMGLLPAMMKAGDPLGAKLEKLGWGRRKPVLPESAPIRKKMRLMENHAIICGFGPVGQQLNKSLIAEGVPTLIVELNAETVHRLKRQGQAVLFADATHAETWELTRLMQARMVAFTFPDATLTLEALALIREHRKDIPVLARARFASDVERLKRFGATVVINDEVEAARAVTDQARVL